MIIEYIFVVDIIKITPLALFIRGPINVLNKVKSRLAAAVQ